MSNKMKALIAAIIVFVSTAFGWYVAYSDGDPTTKPDTDAVIDAGKDVYDKYNDLEEVTVDEPETETPELAE